MVRELRPDEIDEVLREELVGRIGYYDVRRVNIVPIAYAYDGTFVYGYSVDGSKVMSMRKHPSVCFQVDSIHDAANWRSVLGWGRYEELHDDDAVNAVKLISARLRTIASGAQVEAMRSYVSRRGEYGFAYRIRLIEKVGRTEGSER